MSKKYKDMDVEQALVLAAYADEKDYKNKYPYALRVLAEELLWARSLLKAMREA